MSSAALTVALCAGLLAAQTEDPQLVVLPLEAEGVKPQAGIDAWKVIVGEVAKSKAKLKVGVTLQKEIHDLLLGPAREQARDCGESLECFREIGSALDASIVVAGKVTKEEVSLVAVDVATGQKLGAGKSPPNLASGKPDQQSRAAVRALVAAMQKKKKDPAAAAIAAAEATKPKNGDTAAQTPAVPAPVAATTPPKTTETKPAAKPDTKTADATPAIESKPPEDTKTSANDPELPPPSGENVAAEMNDELKSEPASTAGVSSEPAAGSLQPQSETANVNLTPPPAPPPAASPIATSLAREEDVPVTSKWWFWTAIATAVLAGSATTIVLAGGLKGGPEVPSDVGAITGTY